MSVVSTRVDNNDYVDREPEMHYQWEGALPDPATAYGDIFILKDGSNAVFADGTSALDRISNASNFARLHFIVPPWISRRFRRPLDAYNAAALSIATRDTLQIDMNITDAACGGVIGGNALAKDVIDSLKLDVHHDDVCAYVDGRNPYLLAMTVDLRPALMGRHAQFGLANYAWHRKSELDAYLIPVSHDLFWWYPRSENDGLTRAQLQQQLNANGHMWRWGRASTFVRVRVDDAVIAFLDALQPCSAYTNLGCRVSYVINNERTGVVIECTERYARICRERLKARFEVESVIDYGRRLCSLNTDSSRGFQWDNGPDVHYSSTCWAYVHYTTVRVCLGLAALRLPPYVLLAIIDCLPQLWIMTRFVKVGVIEHFVASVRRAKQQSGAQTQQ